MLLIPGEKICDIEDNIYSHNTYPYNNSIHSSVLGTETRINKLLMVVPYKPFRYIPLAGDIILGKISAISIRRWKIEANAQTECILNLTSIELPPNIKRGEEEFYIRTFFDVDDILVAEIQKVNPSSAVLNTRNKKYGKLNNGILKIVPLSIIGKYKSSFVEGKYLKFIIGANGYVFLQLIEQEQVNLRKTVEALQYIEKCILRNKKIDDEVLKTL